MKKEDIEFVAETSLERFLLLHNESIVEKNKELSNKLNETLKREEILTLELTNARNECSGLGGKYNELKSAVITLFKGNLNVVCGDMYIHDNSLEKGKLNALKVLDELFGENLVEEAMEGIARKISKEISNG